MIVYIDEGFITSENNSQNMDHAIFLCRLLEYGHYIDALPKVKETIFSFIEDCGTDEMYSLFSSCSGELLSPSDRIKSQLSTYKLLDYSDKEKQVLFFQPSELLVENAPYEWNVYKRIIKAYTKDRTFGYLAHIINNAVRNYSLVPENAGGAGNIIKMFDLKNNGEYRGLYKSKCCVVFDRDTYNDSIFDHNKNPLFEKFADGKKNDTISVGDIYILPVQGQYIWHMWYKRAIENYFPPQQYKELGVNIPGEAEDNYDYYKFEEGKNENSYKKKYMQNIGTGLPYTYYENATKHFTIGAGNYSEMLILLHKIAKII